MRAVSVIDFSRPSLTITAFTVSRAGNMALSVNSNDKLSGVVMRASGGRIFRLALRA
jgi:hypothetical protein